MPGFVSEHRRSLVVAVFLHALLIVLIAATAWRWSSSRPAVPLAIEGVVVDERTLPPASSEPAEPVTEAAPEPPPEPLPREPEPTLDASAEQARVAEERAREQAAREQAIEAERQAAAERARLQAEAQAREAVEAEKRKTAEAEKRKAAEAEAKRKAEAELLARDAAERREREAELRRQLAAEEEGAAVANSGVMDEYRALLVQAIERSWIRPPSARPGIVCTLYVNQAPGGTVIDVRLGACNADAAVQESITNAVFRASPLPPPSDPRVFQRRLEIVFRPTE